MSETNGVQTTYIDETGRYVWLQPNDKRKGWVRFYIPEEDPMHGAKTHYGAKTFVYDKSTDVWSETKNEQSE